MFLNQLTMDEKEMFMSLALRAAESNDVIADEEYVMLQEYCKEMGIAFFDTKNAKNMEEIMDIFKDSEGVHKKIILFEILALIYSDGEYDDKEKNFVNDFVEKIGLSKDVLEKQIELLQKYIQVTKEIADNIFK